jgi:hypothetical protein
VSGSACWQEAEATALCTFLPTCRFTKLHHVSSHCSSGCGLGLAGQQWQCCPTLCRELPVLPQSLPTKRFCPHVCRIQPACCHSMALPLPCLACGAAAAGVRCGLGTGHDAASHPALLSAGGSGCGAAKPAASKCGSSSSQWRRLSGNTSGGEPVSPPGLSRFASLLWGWPFSVTTFATVGAAAGAARLPVGPTAVVWAATGSVA